MQEKRYQRMGLAISLLQEETFHPDLLRSKLGPGKLIEILWKLACRTSVSLISVLVLGRHTSEIYARIQFFRDVAGQYEDKYPIQLGGAGKAVEGDGMFLIGKRKCGVGRRHSKEHVYVCL